MIHFSLDCTLKKKESIIQTLCYRDLGNKLQCTNE